MTAVESTRNQIIMAHIFCVAQQFSAVVVYVLGKKVIQEVQVWTFVYMRLLFVVPIVILFAALLVRKNWKKSFKVTPKSYLWMLASGIIGIVITQTLMFAGLDKSTATNTSIISAPSIPLFTSLFSVLRGTDKMNKAKGVGFLSSVLGAMLLLQVWNFKFEGTTLGNLLIVGSSLCSAMNSLVQKHVLNAGYHPLVVQTYVCVSGALIFTVAYSPFGLFSLPEWTLSPHLWMCVSIVGVIATGLPWCLGIIALKHTSPMTTSVYVVLQPLIAVLVGFVLNNEVLTWVQILGSGLVLLGLICVNATPIVEKVVKYITSRTSSDKSKQFELLTNEDEEKEGLELQVISEDSTNEVNYELGQSVETNAFVLEEEKPYYKSDDVITTDINYDNNNNNNNNYNNNINNTNIYSISSPSLQKELIVPSVISSQPILVA